MLIGKKTTKAEPSFVRRENFIKVNAALIKCFEKQASVLRDKQDDDAPYLIRDFVSELIKRNDPTELVEFAFIHVQERLYRTLREFVSLNVFDETLSKAEREAFIEIAAQFLTEAYCIYHEPNNMRHQHNRWSYSLALDLIAVFRPFEVERQATPGDKSQPSINIASEE